MSETAVQPQPGRSSLLAFVLGLLALGLGQLYAGSLRRALAALAIGIAALAAAIALFAWPVCSPIPIAVAWAICAAVLVGVPLDAARAARRGRPLSRRRWVEIGWLLAYAVALNVALDRLGPYVRERIAVPFRNPSESMAPGLLVGDHFLVDPAAYRERDPKRGEIVSFRIAVDPNRMTFPADQRPDLPAEHFVKRIIGIPGDRIEVRGDEVWVNGEPLPTRPVGGTYENFAGHELAIETEELLDRSYEILRDAEKVAPSQPPMTVEADRYFVLGDNRSASNDSRFWGTVLRRDLIGPATHLYASWLDGKIHWRRFGMCLR